MGIGMMGVSSETRPCRVGVCRRFYMFSTTLFSNPFVHGAGMVLHSAGTRSIDALGGLLKRMKITGTALLSVPWPFQACLPEWICGRIFDLSGGFKGLALETSDFILSIVAIISLAVIGGLALACFTKVVGVVFQGEPEPGR